MATNKPGTWHKCPHCGRGFMKRYWRKQVLSEGIVQAVGHEELAKANFERHKLACWQKKKTRLEKAGWVTTTVEELFGGR